MSRHSFDPVIAKTVGVNAAVLYQNIVFWTEKNRANKKHFYDGHYWTYNSISAFSDLFPYLTARQIRTALQKLIDEILIAVGDYNKVGYDRTKWYCPKCQMHLSEKSNGFDQNVKPIPDSKPDIEKAIAKAIAKKTEKRGSRIPINWEPPRLETFYTNQKISEREINDEADKFKDYWTSTAGAKGVKLDWTATWRNWVRNRRGQSKLASGVNRPESIAKRRTDIRRKVIEGLEGQG